MVREQTAQEAIIYVSSMVKSRYLGSLMEGSCSSNEVLLSAAKNKVLRNGVPYEITPELSKKLADAIRTAGMQLLNVRILDTPQSEEEYPLCFGDDYVSKFKNLRKAIILPYLFQELMGKTEKWQKMHLSAKDNIYYYNKFKPEELDTINTCIQTIALSLLSVKIK